MTRRRKYALVVVGVAALALVVGISVKQSRAGLVEVQLGKVKRQELTSVVTASGEIRPQHYVNLSAQSYGKITEILVEEGSRVKNGQVLLKLEAIQPAANVEGQRAVVKSAEAAVEAAQASHRTALAEQARAAADFERARLEWERAQLMFREQLISQAEYDARKAAFESAQAATDLAAARIRQTVADLERVRFQLRQTQAQLAQLTDVLQRTICTSPIDGLVTNLPVHVGEQMVPGNEFNPSSFLMTVADMSKVTAEVKVDETDIVNVELGQTAEVTIDAFPNQKFQGMVTEIGTTAIVRSTGQSATQTTTGTQEAKDFKVVVTLSDPLATVRPGLSSTARITTATRKNVLTIPIQALTIRRQADIEAAERAEKQGSARAATSLTASPEDDKKELQGVFVVENGRARFREVKTGITGVTDIEVTEGLKEGEQIVIGSYKVLRELKHLARVREEKAAAKPQP